MNTTRNRVWGRRHCQLFKHQPWLDDTWWSHSISVQEGQQGQMTCREEQFQLLYPSWWPWAPHLPHHYLPNWILQRTILKHKPNLCLRLSSLSRRIWEWVQVDLQNCEDPQKETGRWLYGPNQPKEEVKILSDPKGSCDNMTQRWLLWVSNQINCLFGVHVKPVPDIYK